MHRWNAFRLCPLDPADQLRPLRLMYQPVDSTCAHLSQIERTTFARPILGTQQNKLLPTENVSHVDTPIHIITSAFLLAHYEHLGSWPRNDELLFLCVR